nr:MAG TPA: hypothetical protein [Caudoviricetes sp.]
MTSFSIFKALIASVSSRSTREFTPSSLIELRILLTASSNTGSVNCKVFLHSFLLFSSFIKKKRP